MKMDKYIMECYLINRVNSIATCKKIDEFWSEK